jgi:hypothetical protein
MSFLGIELNDHAITGIRDDQLVFTEKGCALNSNSHVVFGAEALKAAQIQPSAFYDRYWRELAEQPLARVTPELKTSADLAYRQLHGLWGSFGAGITQVAFAVPGYWSTEQLGLLLGIAQEAGMPLTGLVSLPVAATRREYPDYEVIHIETDLHATSLTRMSQEGAAAIAEEPVVLDMGTVQLRRTIAEYFARRFLECSRFDPMQDAGSEQTIYDQLDGWVGILVRNGEAELSTEFKGNQFRALTSSAVLYEWLQRRCQPLIQSLRARTSVDRPTALQLSSSLATYPGVAQMLADLPGCDVFVLEPGAAARGLAQRQESLGGKLGSVTLTEALPWDQPSADVSLERAMAGSAGLVPSHLVLDGRAYRLTDRPLRIGSEANTGDYSLMLSSRHTGVSRHHCSIEFSAGRVVLIDHSRFGTRLNGYRIQGSAVLQPGDTISLGDPVCVLKLVAETGPDEPGTS